MKLDVLAIGAHPDDVELGAGGTVSKLIASGKKVGILDLTLGELGSRGSASIRTKEAMLASEILGLAVREQLNLGDGFLNGDQNKKLEIIKIIRKYQPDIVLANALNDRHIDHGNGAQLTIEAAFLSGLAKVETVFEDKIQDNWRPRFILHYIQDYYMQPTIVVDIKEHYQKKMDAVLAYSSQFFNPNSHEPETPISSEEFLLFLDARMREMGRWVGSKYGEGFISKTPISVLELSKYFPV
jgi:bacillithiol biosynthesis deacetylase BshB1